MEEKPQTPEQDQLDALDFVSIVNSNRPTGFNFCTANLMPKKPYIKDKISTVQVIFGAGTDTNLEEGIRDLIRTASECYGSKTNSHMPSDLKASVPNANFIGGLYFGFNGRRKED